MVNPARWSWRVKFLAVVAIVEPWVSTHEVPAERLPFSLGWIAVGIAYAALAWRARAEPDSDWQFDLFIAGCFMASPLVGMLIDGRISRAGGRLAAMTLGMTLGSEWAVRRRARGTAQGEDSPAGAPGAGQWGAGAQV